MKLSNRWHYIEITKCTIIRILRKMFNYTTIVIKFLK
jgi:hypothetical protein